jgi:hypothetical protein
MMTSLLIRWLGCKIIISIISTTIVLEYRPTAYAKLIKWWAEHKNTAIYIGNGSYKINSDSEKNGSTK